SRARLQPITRQTYYFLILYQRYGENTRFFDKLVKKVLNKTKESNLNSALAYSQMMGWKIFPIHYKSKAPLTRHGVKDATDDVGQIREWWDLYPDAGIGLPTGSVNGIVVVDIDPRNLGNISLERLTDEYGSLPDTVHCLTAGGGDHYHFKYDDRINVSKLNEYAGIDIQGNGKYVILPPSTHPNGKQYEWEASSKAVITPIADMPKYMLDLLHRKSFTMNYSKPPEDYLHILKGVSDGGRNDSMMSLIGYLLAKKIDYRIAYELVTLWNERNDPPLNN